MKNTTLTAMKAIYDSDPARTRGDKAQLLRTLGLEEEAMVAEKKQPDRVISFREASKRLNRCPTTLHLMAKRGAFPKVLFPGGKRCAGIRESDLEHLLANTLGNVN
jgi:predicted DNA-binding transcriptional regulator AlpA